MITGVWYKGYAPRKLPATIAAILKEVNKIKMADFIETSISPYLASMIFVSEPEGNIWVFIELWKVNLCVVNDAYHMQQFEDKLETITGATVFTLDLTKGFQQLLTDEESQEVTAFTTPRGLYRWKVLPLGMKMSRTVFQRVMDTIFKGF